VVDSVQPAAPAASATANGPASVRTSRSRAPGGGARQQRAVPERAGDPADPDRRRSDRLRERQGYPDPQRGVQGEGAQHGSGIAFRVQPARWRPPPGR
jgi:hypothetical protein